MTSALTFRFRNWTGTKGDWRAEFSKFWPAYRRWFLSEGLAVRPTYEASHRAMATHMPELVPLYDDLCNHSDIGDVAARFLSMYCPPTYVTGCSQLVVEGGDGPHLIRNYDYSPRLFEGNVTLTDWQGVGTITSVDSLWGCLDGVNQGGLAISLAFGGRRDVGQGFGVPIILRYVLQCCEDVQQAALAISAVPTHMAYNITVVDKTGAFATIEICPGESARVVQRPFATNHQWDKSWQSYLKLARSLERERILRTLSQAASGEAALLAFQQPPLQSHSYGRGFGTLYTCVMNPAVGSVAFFWPGRQVNQSITDFHERDVLICPSGRGITGTISTRLPSTLG